MSEAAPEGPLRVVPAEQMADDVFIMHLNARHLEDLGMTAPLRYSPLTSEGMSKTQRAFHRRIHKVNTCQHVHEESP